MASKVQNATVCERGLSRSGRNTRPQGIGCKARVGIGPSTFDAYFRRAM